MKILKTTKEIILLTFGMLLLLSNVSADNKDATIKIINAERKVFTLNVEEIRTGNYSVEIKDVNGIVLLQNKISAGKRFSKMYDLSELPIGKYEVEIEGDVFIRKQFVNVLPQRLEVIEEEEVKIFKPSIQLKENRIALNMFSNKGKLVNISILDSEGNLIFEEEIKDNLSIHKFYDLLEVPNGDYTVRIDTQGNSFYKSFGFKKEIK